MGLWLLSCLVYQLVQHGIMLNRSSDNQEERIIKVSAAVAIVLIGFLYLKFSKRVRNTFLNGEKIKFTELI